MTTIIFWFRRDLRISDHIGLATALATGAQVVPVFIVDPTANPGGDIPATRTVMWRTLHALDQDLQVHGSRLLCRKGDPTQIISALVKNARTRQCAYRRHPRPLEAGCRRTPRPLPGLSAAHCRSHRAPLSRHRYV